jgi:hypothetical protein
MHAMVFFVGVDFDHENFKSCKRKRFNRHREGAKMIFDMDKTTDETFGRKEERKVMPFCCISMRAESMDIYP